MQSKEARMTTRVVNNMHKVMKVKNFGIKIPSGYLLADHVD